LRVIKKKKHLERLEVGKVVVREDEGRAIHAPPRELRRVVHPRGGRGREQEVEAPDARRGCYT